MGYLKGLFTSLAITLPSFLFIHIYLQGLWVPTFFRDMVAGNWISLLEVCETTIMEPINIFFVPPNALRILFAFIPWVVAAFVVNFFFRKKHAARGGLATTITLFFIAELVYYLAIQGTVLYVETLTQPNPLYGYLIIQGVVTVVGLIAAVISPFKKDTIDKVKLPPVVAASPPVYQDQQQETFSEAFYMPETSPSRDQYMETQRQPTTNRSQPVPCEYCGSYLDAGSEFCSVCGNRVYGD